MSLERSIAQAPFWKVILSMIFNPGEAIRSKMTQVPCYLALLISGSAFLLFFLQTGLDLARQGSAGFLLVFAIAALGLIYGTAGIVFLAYISWTLTRAQQQGASLAWAVSSFALGYSATLVYSLLGLFFSLAFGWNTAVSFGVTGVLWALRPNMAIVRKMSGDRLGLSLALTSLNGFIILLGWAILGLFQI